MTIKKILEITNNIYIIRGQKVMIDRDLAEHYGVGNHSANFLNF